MNVEHITLKEKMSISQLIGEYKKSGVLGSGDLAKATDIFEEMIRKKATIFLGISGAMIPSGMRTIIADLIKLGYVHVIVTSGANIVHEIIESFGGSHYAGDFHADDTVLRKEGIGRIGNVFTKNRDFEEFEKVTHAMFEDIEGGKRENISIKELIWEIGKRIEDKDSFLRMAYDKKIPIFSPSITDSMLGLHLWLFSQDNKMVLNALKDMKDLADIVYGAKKTGAIFLGGGVSKHYILGANLLREGIDYGIQITMDREETGSLSGAKLEEGISWGKAQKDSRVITLVGEVTVLFPIMVSCIRERLG